MGVFHMGKHIIELIIIIGLPTLAFVGGVRLMTRLSGRERELHFLSTLNPADAKTLDSRLSYDVGTVSRQWGKLQEAGLLSIERYFLELDLAFPFLYGGALAMSLLMAWASLGRPFSPAWLMAPIVVTVVADWTENLVQLAQLNRFQANGAAGLQAGWIGTASIATLLKLVFFCGSCLAVLSLVVAMMVYAIRRA
jgi:hypothetical protein